MQDSVSRPSEPRPGFFSEWFPRRAVELYGLAHWIKKELRSNVPIGFKQRMRMWRHGFFGEAYILYGLERNDWRDYLPDIRRLMNARFVNGPLGPILRNKLLFPLIMAPFPEQRIPILATIERGVVRNSHGHLMSFEKFMDFLSEESEVVVRLGFGGSGTGMCIIRTDGSDFRINNEPADVAKIRFWLRRRPLSVVTPFVRQHEALASLYRGTTNTLRLLTMWDAKIAEPFLAAAAMRIGTSKSFPVDNWSKGGLSAEIEIDSGRVGRAVASPARGSALTWHATHPETGSPIEGAVVPHWKAVVRGIFDIYRYHPQLQCVGWDVVVTPDGYRIIEANDVSGVNLQDKCNGSRSRFGAVRLSISI